jgi:ATP-dependent DNA helicase PIF1
MVELNDKQRLAFEKILSGKNILLTGKAGSGKSYLISRISTHYKKNGLMLGVSATTGISALQIKGSTVHSLLGLGLGTKSAAELFVRNRRKFPKIIKEIKAMSALIIDEISMMSADMLIKISEYLVLARGANVPFGGLQMILCGDFCQLSPVSGDYCFKAPIWGDANIEMVELTQSMRQSGDEKFRNMLDELRFGSCSKEVLACLRSLNKTVFPEGIEPTILYSRNADVDYINTCKLVEIMNIGAETKTYKVKLSEHDLAKSWMDSLRIDDEIMLCEGAQVMLTINLNVAIGLVNGSRGVVLCILDDKVRVRFVNGLVEDIVYYVLKDETEDELFISYIPLKLAYAISIHKSQGLTLDAVEMDLGVSIFADGQAYTALSRARDLNSIRILSVSEKSFKVNKDVKTFYGV